jgi:hypothetical protein
VRLANVARHKHFHSASDAQNSACGIDIHGDWSMAGQRKRPGGAQDGRDVSGGGMDRDQIEHSLSGRDRDGEYDRGNCDDDHQLQHGVPFTPESPHATKVVRARAGAVPPFRIYRLFHETRHAQCTSSCRGPAPVLVP